ncbi:MAG: carbamoyltransferase HypF [Lachnospiraceae bacterium]|nr:carbamoyltransferase HypF [Lachnospiraceae bacterium]
MSADEITRRIRVYGIVQGVGFRPTADRHARTAGIRGTVCNRGSCVDIIAQGTPAQIDRFRSLLQSKPPARAVILGVESAQIAAPHFDGFSIVESEKTSGEIFISPDIATCDTCRKELYDPADRRYLHPFINCTNCGPRLTILESLPYDRERTSMKMFPMCRKCRAEYVMPSSRRYDAQPVCCNKCGPSVYVVDRDGIREQGDSAIRKARKVLAEGGILAVKGVGGFHLCCDALSEEAVNLLRARKTRPRKPFAVMVRDPETAQRECEVSRAQQEILTGHQKPILLLVRKPGGKICEAVAPGNPTLGVMLPYAPVQMLLFSYPDGLDERMPDALVMTSGNVAGAPICRNDGEALRELSGLCDCILSHDRKIRIRADDSVMDFYRGKPYMIRRSRGYAPVPCMLSGFPAREGRQKTGAVLGIGGELKNTFCLGTGNLFYPSSHIGDLGDLRSVKALEETVCRYAKLLELHPEVIACDLHPQYNSAGAAKVLAQEYGAELITVQHHYAHILSCMAENDRMDRVIGAALDGTGYGTDGTIWGGEILIADATGFARLGSIAPFLQVGGDLSAKEGWRIAAAMLDDLSPAGSGESPEELAAEIGLCSELQARVLMRMKRSGMGAVRSTSAGRLFDAVSAVLGICTASSFEGEAAMDLEFAAERFRDTAVRNGTALPGPFAETGLTEREDGFMVMETDRLFRQVLCGRLRGDPADELAYRFHAGLADLVAEACLRACERTGIGTAALSGGCFQNKMLLQMVQERLAGRGMEVLVHSMIPPSDGGIALGQAVAAMERLRVRTKTKNSEGRA